MSDLLKALEHELPELRKCKAREVLRVLDEAERAAVQRVIENIRSAKETNSTPEFSVAWLTKVLIKHGFQVSESSMKRHIGRMCSCE